MIVGATVVVAEAKAATIEDGTPPVAATPVATAEKNVATAAIRRKEA